MKSRWGIFTLLVIAVCLVDQLTKAWVIENVAPYSSITPIPALSPFFSLTHSYNTGAAFGIFPQSGDLFLGLSVLIVIGLTIFYSKLPPIATYTRIGIALIVGGALGNMIDRIQHGHVTDFIYYTIGSFGNISNIADHAVVIGVLIVILDSLRLERIEKQTAEREKEENPADS